jgi:serine protease Do
MRKPFLVPLLLLLPTAAADAGPVDANIFVNLAKKIVPSVVNIQTMTAARGSPFRGGADPNDLFRRFFEDFFRQHGGRGGGEEEEEPPSGPGPGPRGTPRAMSLGTGFIIDASGLILTNNHVVAEADEIKIMFTEETDEKPTDGEVVGRDPELDLALIRVKSKRQMTPLNFGDSDELEVGEYVIAVGNPFGQGHSVTHGIISAKERKAPDFILANYLQTDAPINPGNSGGPLVNLKGEVIGINNAIDQRAQGIGFAIPANLVKKVLPQLKTKGTVARGYIGVLIGDLTPEIAPKLGMPKDARGVLVTQVNPGEPAEKAGLKPYDVILEFNGKAVKSGSELISAVTAVPVGDSVPIKVSRSGDEKSFTIKVAQRPGSFTVAKQDEKKGKKGKKPARVETGMELEDLTEETRRDLGLPDKVHGAVVTSIAYGGPADRAGLLRGDVIVEADRKPVRDVDGFFSVVKAKKSYLLRVRRSDPQGREAFSIIVLDLKEE